MGKYLDVELKGCQQMDKLRAIENEVSPPPFALIDLTII